MWGFTYAVFWKECQGTFGRLELYATERLRGAELSRMKHGHGGTFCEPGQGAVGRAMRDPRGFDLVANTHDMVGGQALLHPVLSRINEPMNPTGKCTQRIPLKSAAWFQHLTVKSERLISKRLLFKTHRLAPLRRGRGDSDEVDGA